MKRTFLILSVILMAALITGVSVDVHAAAQASVDFTYSIGTDEILQSPVTEAAPEK